jgi:lysophospholipase L1-like esterase
VFEALARAESGRSPPPVHILQIGDSHTAGDMITNGWRVPLQQRRGSGGRGVLPGGRPYGGYLTWGVTAAQSGGWRVNALFGGRYNAAGPPMGVAGFTQTASAPGETLGVSADVPDQGFDRMIVCAVTEPGAGSVILRIGDAEESWSLDAPRRGGACRTVDSDARVSSASLETADARPVSIASFGTVRRRGGAILSNVGVVGAQLIHLGRSSDSVMRAELAAYRPALIVLAFGTNEGFSPTIAADTYELQLRDHVARLRRLAGASVPILLVGPPDAATRNASLRPEGDCGDGWGAPRALAAVRERQIKVAREMRLGFWNWAQAMGGRCSAHRWRLAGRMRPDHVHFTREGGEAIGRMIDADLERAAAALPRTRMSPPAAPPPPPPGRRRP